MRSRRSVTSQQQQQPTYAQPPQQQQQPYVLVPPPSSQRQPSIPVPAAPAPAPAASSPAESSSSPSRTTSTNGPAPAVSPVETADYAIECKQCAPPVWLKSTAGLRRHRNKEHVMSVQVTVPDGEGASLRLLLSSSARLATPLTRAPSFSPPPLPRPTVYKVTRIDGVFSCAVCGHSSKDCEYLPAHVKRRPKLCAFEEKWPTVSLPASWERVDPATGPSYTPASSSQSHAASSSASVAPAPAYSSRGPAPASATSPPLSIPARPPPIHTFGYDASSYALAGGPASSQQQRPQQQQQQQYLGAQGYSHPGLQPYPYQQYPAATSAAARPAPQPTYRAPPTTNANIYNSMTGRFVADSAPASGSSVVSGGSASMPSPSVATPSTAATSAAPRPASSATPAGTVDPNAMRALLAPENLARMTLEMRQSVLSHISAYTAQQQRQVSSSTSTPSSASVERAPGQSSTHAAWSQPTTHTSQGQHQAPSSSTSPASASTYMAAALNAPPSAERQHLLDELASSTAGYGPGSSGGPQQHALASGPSQQPSTVAEALNAQSRMIRPADLIQLATRANETNRQQEAAQRSLAVDDSAGAHRESAVGAPAEEEEVGGLEREASAGEQFVDQDAPVGEERGYAHAVAPEPVGDDGGLLPDGDAQMADADGVNPWTYGEGASDVDLHEHSPLRPPAVPAAAMPSVHPAPVTPSTLLLHAGGADAAAFSPPSSAGVVVVESPRADGSASVGEMPASDDSSVLGQQAVAAHAAGASDSPADGKHAGDDGGPEIDEPDFTQTGTGVGRASSAALEAQQEREQSRAGSATPQAPPTEAAHVDLHAVESGGQGGKGAVESGGQGSKGAVDAVGAGGAAGGEMAADGF